MKHVLIIDDSAVVRKVVRRIVEGLELRLSEAENCAQAQVLCAEKMPDVIIVDGSLDGLKPLEFVRQIRQAPDGDQPRIIYCSTENEIAQLAGAMRSGANLFMMKPFTRAELSSQLVDFAA